jgi:hypothetical protein
MHEMKEVSAVEHREELKREPQTTPEPRRDEPRPRRFRIVKLEERIAPMAGGKALDRPNSTTVDPYLC